MNLPACARHATASCAWLAFLPGTALAEAADDIRDIRGPKTVSGSWVLPATLTAVVLVALCVAYIVWARTRRPTPGRTPSLTERTLQRLDSSRSLMRPDTTRAFGTAVSEVIRDYIEQRFNVVATQRTTEEFLQTLLQSSNETLVLHRLLLVEFMQQCDVVKFAGDSTALMDMESLFQSAHRFVLEAGETVAA
jgi:hypothetical protein